MKDVMMKTKMRLEDEILLDSIIQNIQSRMDQKVMEVYHIEGPYFASTPHDECPEVRICMGDEDVLEGIRSMTKAADKFKEFAESVLGYISKGSFIYVDLSEKVYHIVKKSVHIKGGIDVSLAIELDITTALLIQAITVDI